MKAIIILLLSSALILSTSFTTKHDFYVSITEVDYNKETEAIEITFIIFTDDLEKGLEAEGTERIYLGTKKEHKKTDTYIKRYLNKYFTLKTDDKEQTYQYLGKEVEINRTYLYAEIENVKDFKKVEIMNKVLISLYDGQKNIVHVKKNGKKKSLMLFGSKTTDELNF